MNDRKRPPLSTSLLWATSVAGFAILLPPVIATKIAVTAYDRARNR